MRLLASVVVLVGTCSTVLAGGLTQQQRDTGPTIHAYFRCGALLAYEYGLTLRNEPAADLAVVAAQKCKQERNVAMQAVRDSFPSGDWNDITHTIDDEFRSQAMTAALDARTLRKQ